MKIFIVMGRYDYECDDILGAFSTMEKAEERKASEEKNDSYDVVYIVEVELDKK